MKTKKYFFAAFAAMLLIGSTAQAQLIISEPFNYTVPSTAPVAHAGNGLPATNVGGNPAGTSTGVRGTYNAAISVVSGLSYTGLLTSGGAANLTNATWGSDMNFYRDMTTDPFIASRIGNSNRGAFGIDGQTLYMSFLVQTSSATAQSLRWKVSGATGANVYIENTASKWTLNPSGVGVVASTATLELNTPTLIVLKFEFAAGATDKVSLYKNPTIGGSLPATADAEILNQDIPGIITFQTRPAVANAMTLDEIRVGTTYASVTPASIPTAFNSTTVSNTRIYSANGTIHVESANMAQAALYNLSGAIIAKTNTANKAQFVANKGMYIVKVTHKAGKTEALKVVL